MSRPGRRLLALVATLALAAGQPVVCAGPTPGADDRTACCRDDACPMHDALRREADPHAGHHGGGAAPQKTGDCCTISAPSAPDSAVPAAPAAPSLAGPGPAVVLPAALWTGALPRARRASTTALPAHVPRHVLLSVFLV